jgi:multidrug efflux pump subunit AcrA (membrane-fusion protein)
VPATERRLSAAAADLAKLSGAAGVAVVPVLAGGRPVGALSFEREGEAFSAGELEELGAVGAALGPVLAAKADAERLVAGRIAIWTGDALRAVFGPRRPAAKLAALSVAALAAALVFATGEFRVTARAALEGGVQRAAVAPFDGFVAEAPARAGDLVEEGQVLARLDDREMALEAARRRAEREQLLLRHQEALGRQDRTQARILLAQLREAEAQLALVEGRLARAQIRAPFRGVVVSGDLSQQLGAPVETGRVLFEVAPAGAWRVVLRVDERDLRHVQVGQTGTLVPAGMTQQGFPVAVARVTPVAAVQEGRNAFRVEATVHDPEGRLRPGMEGVAKLGAGERNLAWIWTRTLLDWVRIQLWTWLP